MFNLLLILQICSPVSSVTAIYFTVSVHEVKHKIIWDWLGSLNISSKQQLRKKKAMNPGDNWEGLHWGGCWSEEKEGEIM